jgi:AcrR family transcriptional regulator
MARPKGVRNPDFEDKRARLVDALTSFALSTDLERTSLRQFASAAGVAEPTLRHYFTDREGVVKAILARIAERGRPFIAFAATPGQSYAETVRSYLDLSLAGVLHKGFVRAHAFGLIEGMADRELGRAYLEALLEPSLEAIEAKLGPFFPESADPQDARAAAFVLLGAMLMAVIHQRLLGGEEVAKLDVPKFFRRLEEVVLDAFPGEDRTTARSAEPPAPA